MNCDCQCATHMMQMLGAAQVVKKGMSLIIVARCSSPSPAFCFLLHREST